MKPLICESKLSKDSRWYVVTRYTLRPGGVVVAHRKYDVTEQMQHIFSRITNQHAKGVNRVKTYTGSTEGRLAEKCPILAADFWQPGIVVEGKVIRPFPTANGTCYEIQSIEPLEVDGAVCFPKEPGKIKTSRVAVGSLKGFHMALAHSGRDPLQAGDHIVITATGTTPTENDSDMVNFKVKITPAK